MPKAIEDLRGTILREARPILLDHGYENLTIRNVARICDVAVGTVYRYFDSKDELVMEIMNGDWTPVMENIRRIAQDAGTPIDGLRQIANCIRAFLSLYVSAWSEYRSIYRFSGALSRQHDAFIQDICSIVYPLMQRFQPDYDPFLAEFLSRTVMATAAEAPERFEQMLPVFHKLCD